MRYLLMAALIALSACVQPHEMRPVGVLDDHGYSLRQGQACTDQICAEGVVAMALYGPRGEVIPLPVATMTSLGERVTTAAVAVGGLALAGWLDGASHPSAKR